MKSRRRPSPPSRPVRVVVEPAVRDEPEARERALGDIPPRRLYRWPPGRKREVHVRDGFLCQKCARPGRSLDVHHIKDRGFGGGDELDNLITLCSACHHEWTFHADGMIEWERWLRIPMSFAVIAVSVMNSSPTSMTAEVFLAAQTSRADAEARIAEARARAAEDEALRATRDELRRERKRRKDERRAARNRR